MMGELINSMGESFHNVYIYHHIVHFKNSSTAPHIRCSLLYLNKAIKKNTKKTYFKNGQRILNRHSSKEDIRMDNKCMKRC